MKKVTLEVEEILKYTREIEIHVPDDMSEDVLEILMNRMESKESLDDALRVLKKADIKISEYDDSLDSPDSMEVEVLQFIMD
ncbi:hypothetical protein [Paenibacillus oryzisoli]|uniref:Uncharacterized protein n=1 Tax=Paenibacillus oryzisoli TaxID=1850517 RepID=A0A198ADL6_9BACL|nr:hypothetical protein [Paenibacillus oryzisoli]OAS19277.1 hypothetical protein A8708_26570 [Paenibacillus oryzisoli]